jgi:hypothetical protein
MIIAPVAAMKEKYTSGFIFQQDNASPHKACSAALRQIVNVLAWPARSPDLSPIEQIWGLIKQRLRGRAFLNADSLYDAVLNEFCAIPDQTVHNFWSSFRARCLVCARLGGKCINGHWKDVRVAHREYEAGNTGPSLAGSVETFL